MEKIIKNKIGEIQIRYKSVLYIILGVLWSFSNAGYSQGLLTWVALVPYLFFIRYESLKKGIIYSWIFGISAYIFHLWWMANPMIAFFSVNKTLIGMMTGFAAGTFTVIISGIYHGLMYLLVFLITKYIVTKKSGFLFYLIIPVVFTVTDYFFPKLWYDQVGYSQYMFNNVKQVADLFGVPGVTFIIIGFNCALAILLEAFLLKKDQIASLAFFSFVVVIIILSNIYGYNRLKEIQTLQLNSEKIKIGLIQGNNSGLDKRNKNKLVDMLTTYNQLSEKAVQDQAQLVIWPESAIPSYYGVDQENFSMVKTFKNVPLIFGTHIIDFSDKKEKVFNSLVFVSEDNEKLDLYFKHKLLAFVEEFPIPLLNPLMEIYGLRNFTRGKDFRIFSYKNAKMAMNICYEDIIPDFIRKSIFVDNNEANIIVNCTNDSWFGKDIEPNLHLQMAAYRSIENRKFLVRVTCTGYSAVVDAGGKLVYRSNLNEEASTTIDIPLLEKKTVYNQGGWVFIYILGLIILAVFIIGMIRKIKFYSTKEKAIRFSHYKKKLYDTWLN